MSHKKHVGDLVAEPGVVYEVEEITGYLYARGDFGHVRTNDSGAAAVCSEALFKAMLANGYHFADGILAKLIWQKGNIYKVIVCGKSERSYVVSDGQGNYSHGDTLDEARNGLLYKLQSRDTTEFKSWTVNTVVPLASAIKAYRAITGACEAGTRHFCEQQGKLPPKVRICEVIEKTQGAYGSDRFAEFFAARTSVETTEVGKVSQEKAGDQ